MEKFDEKESYLRVATACPEVLVSDVDSNLREISGLYEQAVDSQVSLVVFPELSLTGYTLGDLVQNRHLLEKAERGLMMLAEKTEGSATAMVVGLPIIHRNALYNCAAVLADGKIQGIVPKQNLPAYGEFYEKRWYQTWSQTNTTLCLGQNEIPFGNELLFEINDIPVGVEICEDLWVADPPSRTLAENGALIIANPSASPELVGKASYRRQLVGQQSARLVLAYLYAGCDSSESTMDIVMGGHQLICENGAIIKERRPFALNQRLTYADIDTNHLKHDRRRDTNFANKVGMQTVKIACGMPEYLPAPEVNPYPFLPTNENLAERNERLQSIIDIQAHGLTERVSAIQSKYIHLGLSGGLDSTHALLVACQAAQLLDMEPGKLIRTYTMPGEASSERTQSNAVKLAKALGIPNEVIPIGDLARSELKAIGHDSINQDVTYENAQARIRTTILFNKGNQLGGLVLGTGDLSEIALGWCTYNGDHMSHYHVNAGVPKTLMRHLVQHLSDSYTDQSEARLLLNDILDTPVSPELTQAEEGTLSQKTETIIGPYELHDFFLFHLIRWGEAPAKIQFLAERAFKDAYAPAEISKWLDIFITRFTKNQFKRSAMPDGPKIGSVSLSPRGDWRMPSDLRNTALWST